MSDLIAELYLINDLKLRYCVAKYLDNCVPSYFFEVSASSSGKYHPQYTLGVGGLVRHTKAVVKLAEELMQLEQYADLRNSYHDEIITACIIHDTFKHGEVDEGHTVFMHPLIASEKFGQFCVASKAECSPQSVSVICGCVSSHMGQWNISKDGTKKLPKPLTKEQQFVHMCDYLASRRNIIVRVE